MIFCYYGHFEKFLRTVSDGLSFSNLFLKKNYFTEMNFACLVVENLENFFIMVYMAGSMKSYNMECSLIFFLIISR